MSPREASTSKNNFSGAGVRDEGGALVIQRPRCGDIDAIAERTFCGTLYNIEFGKMKKWWICKYAFPFDSPPF